LKFIKIRNFYLLNLGRIKNERGRERKKLI